MNSNIKKRLEELRDSLKEYYDESWDYSKEIEDALCAFDSILSDWPESDWQPMEKAPKDGTRILVWVESQDLESPECWVMSFRGGVWCDTDNFPIHGYETLHCWQHRPAPPEVQG